MMTLHAMTNQMNIHLIDQIVVIDFERACAQQQRSRCIEKGGRCGFYCEARCMQSKQEQQWLRKREVEEPCLTISVLQLGSEHVYRLDLFFGDIEGSKKLEISSSSMQIATSQRPSSLLESLAPQSQSKKIMKTR